MTTATKTPKCFEKIATDSPTYLCGNQIWASTTVCGR